MFNPYGLGHGDLNVVDMVAVPQRLEDAVGKAQHQDVLNCLFSEEVIDPINLILGKYLEDLPVEGLGRCQVVPEGFLDDHPPPRMVRLPGEPCTAKLLDHRAKESVGNGQVEQYVRRIVLARTLLLENRRQPTKSLWFSEISSHIAHSAREPGPGLLIDCTDSGASERMHHLGQAIAPTLVGLV